MITICCPNKCPSHAMSPPEASFVMRLFHPLFPHPHQSALFALGSFVLWCWLLLVGLSSFPMAVGWTQRVDSNAKPHMESTCQTSKGGCCCCRGSRAPLHSVGMMLAGILNVPVPNEQLRNQQAVPPTQEVATM